MTPFEQLGARPGRPPRHCADEYWQNLYAQIQLAADCGHAKGTYEVIKIATGPTSVKTAPLKSKTGKVITEQSMQLQRWVEHYLELYSTQNIVTDTALNFLPRLPVIEKLDNTPTLEELSIAIDGLACGKAPAEDGIPPEVLKHGKQTILHPLHELLCPAHVLGARSHPPRHERCQHSHPVQEQG